MRQTLDESADFLCKNTKNRTKENDMSKRLNVYKDQKPIYDIVMEPSFEKLTEEVNKFHLSERKICIVTDTNVAPLYLEEVKERLSKCCKKISYFVIPAGEENKNLDTVKKIYEHLILEHFDRKDMLAALGGGVIGDLAGFAAATFLRGIKYVQIPTSLLAQVDSSVGGKVAVDLPEGKNLAGAFYQPSLVLIDPLVLDTLPERYIHDGMGEVIKYGCIKDADLFEQLENAGSFSALKSMLPDIIYRCVDIKRMIVEEDQFDTGNRMLLNFGHTLAHAIEQHYNYKRESHGEAVSIGMYQLTRIAEEHGLSTPGTASRIKSLLIAYGLPYQCTLPLSELTKAIVLDKKNLNDHLNIILLHNVGDSYIYPATTAFFTENERII